MSKRILVVDNDQIHRQVLCEIAEGIGYEAVAVDRAMEGWRVLQEQTISLILLDIKMPQVHGHQFLRYIRGKGKVTPVIIISGDEVDYFIEADPLTQILRKPIVFTDLKQTMERIQF